MADEGFLVNPVFEASDIKSGGITPKYVTQVGTVKGGQVVPNNGPDLILSRSVHFRTTTGNLVQIMDIVKDLGLVADASFNGYYIVIYPMLKVGQGDAALTDDLLFMISDSPTGATPRGELSLEDAGDLKTAPQSLRFNLEDSTEGRYLLADFVDWAAAETHNATAIIELWRYPKNTYDKIDDASS